jgi:hypothetical protein
MGRGRMGTFWLGITVALIPSAILIGWIAWQGGVFSRPKKRRIADS